MKKPIQFISGIILILFGFSGMKVAADSQYIFQNSANLSTWLWDTSRIVSESDMIITNLVNHKVKDLLLQIDTTIEQQVYREFIKKASANGIRVHALDGAPQWVDNNGPKLQGIFLNWLKDYQGAASKNEKFKGIHLDVEPYEHKRYDTESKKLLEQYQTMMISFRNQANQMNLEFGIDIPFWFYGVMYDNQYGYGNMAEWLCQHVKYITIMAYRDTAAGTDGIVGIAAKEMKMFNDYNVKGTIAVETGRLTDEYKFVTFYEESQDYMFKQLDFVYKHYKNDSAFHGIAIHYYDSWMAMK